MSAAEEMPRSGLAPYRFHTTTTASYRPSQHIVPRASEMVGGRGFGRGMPTREESRAHREAKAERLRRQRAAQIRVNEAREVIAEARGLRRVVLDLHEPMFGWDGVSLVCGGCDRGDGYDSGDAPWPCTTWNRVLETPE